MSMEQWWNVDQRRETEATSRENCFSATSAYTKQTIIGQKPEPSRLTYIMATTINERMSINIFHVCKKKKTK
jgi:hypothetical protein